MAILRTAAIVTLAAVLFLAAGCRKFGKSLALPSRPQLPYTYSQKDYDVDIAEYNANASVITDDAKQKLARAARPRKHYLARWERRSPGSI